MMNSYTPSSGILISTNTTSIAGLSPPNSSSSSISVISSSSSTSSFSSLNIGGGASHHSNSHHNIGSLSSSSSLSLSTPLLPSLTGQSASAPSSGLSSPKTPSSGNASLKNSINGISSGIDKISLYSKDTNCILSCDTDREREINEAEELFQSLPELTYFVTKINQWKKLQKRRLKLTSKGIENIRGEVTSSLYYYSDIRSIYNRDSETFVIEYHGASHPYVYRCSVGYQIVQEISSRLKLRQTTDKKKHSFDIALEYQKKLKNKNRQSEQVDKDFLNNLNNNINNNINNQQQQQQEIINNDQETKQISPDSFKTSRSSSFDNNYSDESSISSMSPCSPVNRNNEPLLNLEGFDEDPQDGDDDGDEQHKCKATKRATKLSQILGNTEEQRIQTEVDKVILNPQSQERRAIQQFMSNFAVLLKNPATAIMIVRQFIDTTKQSVLADKDGHLQKLMINATASPYQEELSLPTIVEKSLEKSIILRAHKQINNIISQQVAKEEQQLQEIIAKLQNRPQEFFGIKDEFISSNHWKSAILELSCLGRCEIPHDKLDTILSSARAIYNSLNYEKNLKNKVHQDYFLSADDFLPIYLYVVVNSGVKDLEFTNQYLWQLSDPDKLGGEGGYYLTVFSSILSLIKSLNMENIDKANIVDDLIPSITLKNSDSDDISKKSSWHGATISSRKERKQSLSLGGVGKNNILSNHF
ncbi:hypothetical protein CYY_000429 [Polysphondylium violaceum]|uniref:VPS9 domain-containing protein n=1 Tax=Polysphondylium violaceum TaxID=133409 RepID=A0A8J4VBJ0_9MYCE|nr:hypothetical protein CYY_000429 [Polysphondylium violaceum]